MSSIGKVQVDFSQLTKFQKKLEQMGKWESARKTVINNLASRLLTLVKKKTQVGKYPKSSGKKGGTLRKSWSVELHDMGTKGYEAIIYSNVNYAGYVEFGHRKRNNKGWVEGRFWLSKSEEQIVREAPAMIQAKLESFLREMM